MEYNFDFVINPKKIVKLSIMCLGFQFNRETLKVMGYPEKVNIGLDYTNKALCIRPATADKNIKQYLLWKPKDHRFGKINCGGIVNEIARLIDTTFGIRVKQFKAVYDENSRELIVDLTKELK